MAARPRRETIADVISNAAMIRPMTAADASTVAALHAESWRTAYRGIYDDQWLDEHAGADRQAHWARRFASPSATEAGLVAEVDGRAVGFAYLIADDDPSRGALLDNLHLVAASRGGGIGAALLRAAAALAIVRAWPAGLHLWVFDANEAACRFYERHGGRLVERIVYDAADGGSHPARCYHWDGAAAAALAAGATAADAP